MSQTEDILDAAHAIHPYLKGLLGDQAETTENELDELLKQARNGQQVDAQILSILLRHASTREWLMEYFKGKHASEQDEERTKSYQPPLGIPLTLGAQSPPRYRCPRPDHQDYIICQQAVGQKMHCPMHNIPLMRVVNNSGGEHAHEVDGGAR